MDLDGFDPNSFSGNLPPFSTPIPSFPAAPIASTSSHSPPLATLPSLPTTLQGIVDEKDWNDLARQVVGFDPKAGLDLATLATTVQSFNAPIQGQGVEAQYVSENGEQMKDNSNLAAIPEISSGNFKNRYTQANGAAKYLICTILNVQVTWGGNPKKAKELAAKLLRYWFPEMRLDVNGWKADSFLEARFSDKRRTVTGGKKPVKKEETADDEIKNGNDVSSLFLFHPSTLPHDSQSTLSCPDCDGVTRSTRFFF